MDKHNLLGSSPSSPSDVVEEARRMVLEMSGSNFQDELSLGARLGQLVCSDEDRTERIGSARLSAFQAIMDAILLPLCYAVRAISLAMYAIHPQGVPADNKVEFKESYSDNGDLVTNIAAIIAGASEILSEDHIRDMPGGGQAIKRLTRGLAFLCSPEIRNIMLDVIVPLAVAIKEIDNDPKAVDAKIAAAAEED